MSNPGRIAPRFTQSFQPEYVSLVSGLTETPPHPPVSVPSSRILPSSHSVDIPAAVFKIFLKISVTSSMLVGSWPFIVS